MALSLEGLTPGAPMKQLIFTFLIFSLLVGTAQANDDLITISAVGDLMIGTDFPSNRLPPNEGREIFEQPLTYIQAADIRFGNLEGTLYDGPLAAGSKSRGPNRHHFRTPTRFAERFKEAGFNVVSLANNHSRDFGPAGLKSTKDTLRQVGIQYASKEGDIADFTVRGARVGFIAADYYDGGHSITRPEFLYERIRELSNKYDILVVSVHAGGEGIGATRVPVGNEIFMGENRGNSMQFARRAIELGADLILMHGPHVPRGMEIHQERLIVYSLGNFATGQGISVSGEAGYAPLLRVQLEKNGRLNRGHLASFEQRGGGVVLYDKENKARRLIESRSREQFPKTAPIFAKDGFFSSPGRSSGSH